eukprot:1640824-Prymnesium_polylepis.1
MLAPLGLKLVVSRAAGDSDATPQTNTSVWVGFHPYTDGSWALSNLGSSPLRYDVTSALGRREGGVGARDWALRTA